MVWRVDRPQRGGAGECRNRDVQSHSQKTGIEWKTAPDFTTPGFHVVEISEALQGGALRFVWCHAALDVGARSHFNMEAQFSLNFTGDLIVMQTGANGINCGSDP